MPVLVMFQTLLGGVFLASAAAKVRDAAPAARFTATVFRLAGVPGRLARPALAAVVAGEAAVVVLLLAPLALPSAPSSALPEALSDALSEVGPRLAPAGFTLAVVLLLAFSAALALAVRAQARTPCGCFGGSSEPGARHLVRNAVLVAVAATGALAGPPPPAPAGETFAAAAVGVVLAVAVVVLDELAAAFARPLTDRLRRLP